jgi:hypothetical protein
MSSTTEYTGSPFPGLPTDDEIIHLCNQKGPRFNILKYELGGFPIAYIKYGHSVDMGEVWAQLYAKPFVRVPEIYRAFKRDRATYIFMEYIDGQTVRERLLGDQACRDQIYDQVATALYRLLTIRVPQESRPGPIGGGLIQHCFFYDFTACKEFASVPDLQNYINLVLLNNLFACTTLWMY